MSDVNHARAWLRLRVAAWLALAVHLVAGLALAVILRQGLETNPILEARLTFLVEHTLLWVGGWLTWNAAAISILYFYAALTWAHATDGKTATTPLTFAVILSAIGVAADLSAEVIEMGVLPDLARQALIEAGRGVGQMTAASTFLALHRTAVVLTGYLANGLYTSSAILLTYSTCHAYPRWVWMAGVGVGVSGLALSGASLVGSVTGMYVANVVLVPCIVLWQAGVAITAATRARSCSR